MPRFHFDVYDGVCTHDRDGIVLADLSEARRHALSRAGGILDEEEQRGRLGEDCGMEVTDENGRLLFRLDFVVERD